VHCRTSRSGHGRLSHGKRDTPTFWPQWRTTASTWLRTRFRASRLDSLGASRFRRGSPGSRACVSRLSRRAWSGRWTSHVRWPRCDRGCISYHPPVTGQSRQSRARPRKDLRQTQITPNARFSSSLLYPAINCRPPAAARIFASPRAVFVCGRATLLKSQPACEQHYQINKDDQPCAPSSHCVLRLSIE